MARPRTYATNAERQHAYRERHHVCSAESLLGRSVETALWRLAEGDPDVFDRMCSALAREMPAVQAALKASDDRDRVQRIALQAAGAFGKALPD